ncbi:endonuclease III domain-containing protein [Virgibacillus sp. W0181]|uniref:endonuclease III domain-containing protein n=1 Tax=Virgibacillus sp. W0181 TaxID=3391581 RepID=UPI003F451308
MKYRLFDGDEHTHMNKNAYDIYTYLFNAYGPQGWWPASSDFEIMMGAILVQNTKWLQVERAMTRLRPYLTPVQIDRLPMEELARLIRPSGFYNMKAKRIKNFMVWYKRYHFSVAEVKKRDRQLLREELLAINGIGKETADVLLLYVFGIPVFIVDAYARRIFERLGFDMPKQYDTFRMDVERQLPKDATVHNEFHALLVEHAKDVCTSVPRCHKCPLLSICEQRIRT